MIILIFFAEIELWIFELMKRSAHYLIWLSSFPKPIFNDISHFFVSFFKVHFLKIKYFYIDILVLDMTCTYSSVPTIIVFTIFNFPRTWLLSATNNKSRCCSQISFSIFHKLNRGSNSTVNWGGFGSVILEIIFF